MLIANIYPLQLFLEHVLLLWSLGVYLLSWCWLPLLDATKFASCDNLHSRVYETGIQCTLSHAPLRPSDIICKLCPYSSPKISTQKHTDVHIFHAFVLLFHSYAEHAQYSHLLIQQQELINIRRNTGLGCISLDDMITISCCANCS